MKKIDVSKKYPGKLKVLQELYDAQAKKYNIYPFIDWDDVFKRRLHHANEAGAVTGAK